MRVLVDIQGMQNGSRLRGIGRYVHSLAIALQAISANREIDICFLVSDLFAENVDEVFASFGNNFGSVSFTRFSGVGPIAELDSDNAWRRRTTELLYQDFVRSAEPDVLLLGSVMEGAADNSVAAFAERRNFAVLSILYDLIPLISPELHLRSASMKKWYHRRLELLTSSDALLAISESARQEAVQYAGLPEERVVNIGAAAGHMFGAEVSNDLADADDASIRRYFGISRPYVMFTSAFDSRKNFEGLIKAYSTLDAVLKKEHQLVLVCKLADHQRKTLEEFVRRCGLSDGDDVVLTGFVADDDLLALYRGCRLFVFPSFHEGFGLPALEAMWCGVPTIGSSVSSLPEVIGLEEALFDPTDTTGMSVLISRCLQDESFRSLLVSHAHTQCRKFSWEAVAERVACVIARFGSRNVRAQQPSEDELIESIGALCASGGPTMADLAQTAKAIHANRIAAMDIWEGALDPQCSGVPTQSALR